MPVRIIIFDDNEKLRHSLVTVLNTSDQYEVVGNYSNVLNVKNIISETFPDVVILDIEMPEKDGISAVSEIKEIFPEASIIMYTQYEDEDKLFSSIRAGADGYILKKTPPQLLFEAIEEVSTGGAPLSPSIAKRMLASFRSGPRSNIYALTPREIEIMQLLVKGFGVKLIAAELFISYETAKTHLKNIYRKLHVNCGKEAIAKVLAEKITF